MILSKNRFPLRERFLLFFRSGFADEVAEAKNDDEENEGDGDVEEKATGNIGLFQAQQVETVVDAQQDGQHDRATHKGCHHAPQGAPHAIAKQLPVSAENHHRSQQEHEPSKRGDIVKHVQYHKH